MKHVKKTGSTGTVSVLKRTVTDFLADDSIAMAAATSYFTAFSLPPVLVLIMLLAGFFIDPDTVRTAIELQMSSLLGPRTAQQISTIIDQADKPEFNGPLAVVLSIGALLISATGAFLQLQAALNRVWKVEPDPKQGGIRNFVMKRLFSLGMVVVIAFLLLVALVVSTVIEAAGGYIGRLLPGEVTGWFLSAANFTLSFAIVTFLFAAMFKVLPDAKIAWKDVLFGAAVTSALFTIGKFLIGLYLGRSNPGNAFGAAGSFAVILIWIYYTAMIVFLGAEFTHAWITRKGNQPLPEKGAVAVRHRKTRIPSFIRWVPGLGRQR